jgi:hypothetical protein
MQTGQDHVSKSTCENGALALKKNATLPSDCRGYCTCASHRSPRPASGPASAKTPRAPPTARYSTPRLGGTAASLAKALNPNHRRAGAHIVMVCRLPQRCAALHPRYHSRPHVHRISLRHGLLQKRIVARQTRSLTNPKDPPVQSGRNML